MSEAQFRPAGIAETPETIAHRTELSVDFLS
jgi:hypothetical protein